MQQSRRTTCRAVQFPRQDYRIRLKERIFSYSSDLYLGPIEELCACQMLLNFHRGSDNGRGPFDTHHGLSLEEILVQRS